MQRAGNLSAVRTQEVVSTRAKCATFTPTVLLERMRASSVVRFFFLFVFMLLKSHEAEQDGAFGETVALNFYLSD